MFFLVKKKTNQKNLGPSGVIVRRRFEVSGSHDMEATDMFTSL